MSSASRKKTLIRSIRLSSEHDRVLEEEAKRKGLSVNSLLTTIITRYVEWDRFAERFGVVSVSRQGFKSMFDIFSDEMLLAHGRDVGARSATEITRFWFGKLNLETFLSFIALQSRYAGIYHYELSIKGRTYTVTFHHELGPRYNVVLANYFDQAIRNIVGVSPKIEKGINTIVVSFEEPRP